MAIRRFHRRGSASVVLTTLLSTGLVIFVAATAVSCYLCFNAREENRDLTAQNRALGADRDGVVAQLSETQKQLADMQAKLTEKSRVPFSVTYRNAILGPGLVLQITNRSDKALSAVATFVDPTLNKQKTMNLVLRPGQMQQIGSTDGWAFASGNQITITNADFAPLVLHIP